VLGGLLLMHLATGWLEHLLLFVAITFRDDQHHRWVRP